MRKILLYFDIISLPRSTKITSQIKQYSKTLTVL